MEKILALAVILISLDEHQNVELKLKIIHSFWSKPSVFKGQISSENRVKGGWVETKYNYFSWALSCHRAHDLYSNVQLVTDRLGKNLLVDCLKLPYSKVTLELESISSYPTDLWALGKILTYSIQKTPFIHIDGDVYMWAQFKRHLTKAPLVAQNLEYNLDFYREIIDAVKLQDFVLPRFIEDIDRMSITSANAGILGGNDLIFFKKYCSEVFDFLSTNKERLETLPDAGLINPFVEQLFFKRLSDVQGKEISYLLPQVNPQNSDLISFHNTPFKGNTYIHVYSKSLKKTRNIANKVELYLRHFYPKTYFRIKDMMRDWTI